MDSVIFPCDLHNWREVRSKLENLQNVQSPTQIIQVLHDIRIQVQETHEVLSDRERAENCFKGLRKFLLEEATHGETEQFLQYTLPGIIHLALQIEYLRPATGIQICKQQQGGSVEVTSELIASVVACSFLCLFPGRKAQKDGILNTANFTIFFAHLANPAQCAKLRCFLHYFDRVIRDGSKGKLTFTRKVIPPSQTPALSDWLSCNKPLCPINIYHTGVIEDAGSHTLQVDFANAKIGGGVLGTGRVQEEIRFSTSPELIFAMLVMETMEDNEAIWVSGHETFSKHSGYAKTLKFVGDHIDQARRDSSDSMDTLICCIDALRKASRRQYQGINLERELTKLYTGFCPPQCIQHARYHVNSRKLSDAEEYYSACESVSEDTITFPCICPLEPASPKSPRTSFSDFHFADSCISPSSIKSQPGGPPMRANSLRDEMDPLDGSSLGSIPDNLGSAVAGVTPELDNLPPEDYASSEAYVLPLWLQAERRRSSQVSDASRRSSSSTKNSSDVSSEFEEVYESFQRYEQRMRHSAIKEETQDIPSTNANLMVQEFASKMVSNLFDQSSSEVATQLEGLNSDPNTQPGGAYSVQQFDTRRPRNLTQPTPVRPRNLVQPIAIQPTMQNTTAETINITNSQDIRYQDNYIAPQSYSDISATTVETPGAENHNQTDDEKAKDSIAQFVNSLVQNAVHTARNTVENIGANGSQSVDSATHRGYQLSVNGAQASARSRPSYGHVSPRDESLTDDIKQAVVDGISASNFIEFLGDPHVDSGSYSGNDSTQILNVNTSPSAHVRMPRSQSLSPRDVRRRPLESGYHSGHASSGSSRMPRVSCPVAETEGITYGAVEGLDDTSRRIIDVSLKASRSDEGQNGMGGFADVMVKSIMSTAQNDLNQPIIEEKNELQEEQEDEAKLFCQAECLVESAIQRAVYQVYGYKDILVFFTPIQQQGAAPANKKLHRQESAPCVTSDLGSYIERRQAFHHKKRGSSCDSDATSYTSRKSSRDIDNNGRRRSSGNFLDPTLSQFEDQLINSNSNSPSMAMFSHRRDSSDWLSSHRGSIDSRVSSIDLPFVRRDSSSYDMLNLTNGEDENWSLPGETCTARHSLSSHRFLQNLLNPTTTSRSRTVSGTSHMDWFAKDLLLDSFHDAFTTLFGDDYEQVYICEQLEQSHSVIYKYAEQFVQKVMQEAVDIVKSQSTHNELADYEDALDIPYNLIDGFSTDISYSILNDSLSTVCKWYGGDPECISHFGSHYKPHSNKIFKEYTMREIATGNWGCGAFRGDPQLKALLQWMVASVVHSPCLHYYTFGDERMHEFDLVCEVIERMGWTVCELLDHVQLYCQDKDDVPSNDNFTLFDSILELS